MKAWLGLGSNLQQPVKQLKEALNRLAETDQVTVLRVSSFYRTPPWGDKQQNEFINAVAEIETSLAPAPLLRLLQLIENTMGRQRSGRRWGPRKIDLDLLLYAEQQYQSAELVVPHPRMFERAFVLVPMFELEAELEVPGHGRIEKLLQKLDCSGIKRLTDEA
ncbi:2-amino-4-hydroxy-6-hydroxymethyldihydropteridine diphosphokinase [Pseudomonadota bacterium]